MVHVDMNRIIAFPEIEDLMMTSSEKSTAASKTSKVNFN